MEYYSKESSWFCSSFFVSLINHMKRPKPTVRQSFCQYFVTSSLWIIGSYWRCKTYKSLQWFSKNSCSLWCSNHTNKQEVMADESTSGALVSVSRRRALISLRCGFLNISQVITLIFILEIWSILSEQELFVCWCEAWRRTIFQLQKKKRFSGFYLFHVISWELKRSRKSPF